MLLQTVRLTSKASIQYASAIGDRWPLNYSIPLWLSLHFSWQPVLVVQLDGSVDEADKASRQNACKKIFRVKRFLQTIVPKNCATHHTKLITQSSSLSPLDHHDIIRRCCLPVDRCFLPLGSQLAALRQ